MIVRCTGKLLNLLGKRAVTLVDAPRRRESSPVGEIRRRDRLGGLIHEYYRAAA